MKIFLQGSSKYKTIGKLTIISIATLLMIFAGTASNDSQYHSVYAATKSSTQTTSSSPSSSKGGGSSSSNSTSPIGSSTFLNVITKVDNSKGGTSKPSDFTITVSGKSPSPKSFSGSSSGTSVTLKAGKYKVTGSGPSGYTTKYSSGCSGTASGGVPIKCTISASYSSPTPTPSPSGSNNTSAKSNEEVATLHLIIVDKANCHIFTCPALGNTIIDVYDLNTASLVESINPANSNHYDVYATVGHVIKVVARVVATIKSPFTYQEAQLITPPYTGKVCGTNACAVTMPAAGTGQAYAIQIEIDTYYKCKPSLC
jgi:hypothetical protein